jgi:hypothetical protein
MYYNHLLRDNIQEWRNQLEKSHIDDFKDNFIFFVQKINQEPCLLCIIEDIITEYPLKESELENWLDQFYYDQTKYKNNRHKLSYCIYTYKYFFSKQEEFLYISLGGRTRDERIQIIKDRIITPVVNYLHESLDNVNNLLYILERYKLRTEWFTKDILKEKYNNVSNKQYEQIFEDDIRLYLFDQGIDYPFSTPKSASGRADVVSLVNTEDPLVMEIKIFDSKKGYRKDRIISGFTQAVKYTNDYHKNIGYLVVFNIDNVEIEIENKEIDNKWPNRIFFNGKTYYIIIINLNYDVSASNQKELKKITIPIQSTMEI